MTVGELREHLEGYEEEQEIRVAFQPSWPLRARIQHVTSGEEVHGELYDDEDAKEIADFVWIAVDQVGGDENPYAPKGAWG